MMPRICVRRLVARFLMLGGVIGLLALDTPAVSAWAQAPSPPPSPFAMCPASPTPGFSFTSLYIGSAWFVDLEGSQSDDLMIAGAGMRAVIRGQGGDDTICSFGPSNDVIYGGPGNDRIFAGPGNDVVFAGPGNDYIDCGPGYDVAYGGGGNDTFVNCEEIHP